MKHLLILTTLIFTFIISSVAHAEWTKIVGLKSGNSFFVDFDKIKQRRVNRNYLTYFWFLADYSKPVAGDTLSTKSYSAVICRKSGKFETKRLQTFHYDSPMASGPPIESNYSASPWSYSKPNTVKHVMLKAVCNHKF